MRWLWPPQQRRAHLFPDDGTRSLCGKYDTLGLAPEDAFDPAEITAETVAVKRQDCAECVKRAVKVAPQLDERER